MKLPATIEEHKKEIVALCQQHHVTELSVFGSLVRDDFHPGSDIDFLLEYDYVSTSKDPLGNMISLKEMLELVLRRNADPVEYSQLTNKFLRYFINNEKQVLYA